MKMGDKDSYQKALAQVRHLPGFVGLGVGLRETLGKLTAALAWRVYVDRKQPNAWLGMGERVPKRLLGWSTDVLERPSSDDFAARKVLKEDTWPSNRLTEGLAITNDAGVPGTMGCVANLRRTGEPVLLTSYHLLFARGCKSGDPVWAAGSNAVGGPQLIGHALGGKAGLVLGLDPPTFVDAATVRLLDDDSADAGDKVFQPIAQAEVAEKVSKVGAATGRTHGIIVDIAYPDHWYWEYQSTNAPRQILARSIDGRPFSRTGDSGAVIRNESGQIVGLLWGTTARGEGVASPIHGVARALGLAVVKSSEPEFS